MEQTPLTRRNLLGAGLAAAAGTTLAKAEAASSAQGYRLRLSLAGFSFRKYLRGGADKATMTISEFIELGASLGLDAVEPTAYYIYRTDKAYLHELKALAFRKGIEISGTAIGNNFCASAGKPLDDELRKFRGWVDAAIELGAPHIRVFAGRPPKDADRKRDFAQAIEMMKRAVDYAASRGVFLGIENHGYLTETADDVLRFIEAVPSPWLGVNLDTGNFDDDGYAQIAKLAPRAVNCQLKTDIPDGGRKQEVDIARVFSILRRADYHGYVALEYESNDDPKKAVPHYVRKMQALAGSVA